MEQMMEQPVDELRSGPRHAKPVTTMGRLKFALSKGPAKWNWKTNLVAVLLIIGVVIGISVAASIAAVTSLVDIQNL